MTSATSPRNNNRAEDAAAPELGDRELSPPDPEEPSPTSLPDPDEELPGGELSLADSCVAFPPSKTVLPAFSSTDAMSRQSNTPTVFFYFRHNEYRIKIGLKLNT